MPETKVNDIAVDWPKIPRQMLLEALRDLPHGAGANLWKYKKSELVDIARRVIANGHGERLLEELRGLTRFEVFKPAAEALGAAAPRRLFRIKPGIKPYPGKRLEATEVGERTVVGWVDLGGGRGFATAKRGYRHDEVEEITPKRSSKP